MTKVVVLDTNVLLADPNVLLSFPRCDVVLPETVLGELDKLKTARVDPDLRFRGREVSRILFDLSEEGSLIDGVELPDGGTLRVAPFESEGPLPNGLQTRNADDRILATVFQLLDNYGEDAEVTLVTNDLNMLLKAQTLGIQVQRHGDGTEGGFARRFIIRPFQRYRVPLSILAVALAVFGGVIVLVVWGPGAVRTSSTTIPPEFRTLLTQSQQQALTYLTTLQRNPNDTQSLLGMGNFFFDQNRQAQNQGDAATAIVYGQQGLPYYEQYLHLAPADLNARSDYAALLFYTGQADRAVQEVATVLQQDPNNVSANFNLGIFYWQGNRQDLKGAANQFKKVQKLVQNNPSQQQIYTTAAADLDAIQKQAAATGIKIDTTSTVAP
ncbi:MAG: PIN domain-containing protein [Coriobacteriia bacterium]|nr:PIN domain-containing protein [Coriobacteriia bacterium]